MGACMKAEDCPDGYYGYEPDHICITKAQCIGEKDWFIYQKSCIEKCDNLLDMPLNHLGLCTTECPATYYSNNGKGICLLSTQCPEGMYG